MKLHSYGLSDIGHVRSENEDSFLCSDGLALYAVADGIGGLPAGAQASRQTLRTLESLVRAHGDHTVNYEDLLTEVNQTVFELGRRISPRYGIGSTLTFGHIVRGHFFVGHVGDSTAFRLRGGELEQLTYDHTIENEMAERTARGESLTVLLENRNALTRCIGQPPPLKGQCTSHPIELKDRYLLATDGISRFVSTDEIIEIVGNAQTPTLASHQLVDLANERGGLDNATAVLVFVE